MVKGKNFRKRSASEDCDSSGSEEEQGRRVALEEVKLVQKQRERKSGIPAIITAIPSAIPAGNTADSRQDGSGEGGDKDELVLQDTFAQETAVMVEDPNMLRYVEQELAKKKGKPIDDAETQVQNALKRAQDQLYEIPDHLRVKRRNSQESSTQWTTGIAEVQLPMEYKLRNIEETEAAKKLLQEKRRADTNIPSADYSQRGTSTRREHPESYRDKDVKKNGLESGPDGAVQRQAATDELMLERFRRRERHRGMRR